MIKKNRNFYISMFIFNVIANLNGEYSNSNPFPWVWIFDYKTFFIVSIFISITMKINADLIKQKGIISKE